MSNSNLVATAANNFMLLTVSVGKCDPMKLSRQASDSAASACEVSGSVPVNTRVGALGAHTNELKKGVISKFAAVRTYLYENSLPLHSGPGQTRGERLVSVAKLPVVLTGLGNRKKAAEDALTEFMPQYESYYAQRSNDLGSVRDVQMLDPDQVRSKFYVTIAPPAPIPQVDLSGLNLPASLAQEIADRHASTIADQLQSAREAAIVGARDHMAVVAKQLKDGTRLHQSLIDNARRHADLLEGMVSGYDNDPRIAQLVEEIRKGIVAHADIDRLKNSGFKKYNAQKVADNAAKALDKIVKAPKAETSTIITGDSLLADLID